MVPRERERERERERTPMFASENNIVVSFWGMCFTRVYYLAKVMQR